MNECAHCVIVKNTRYCKAKDRQLIGTECSSCPLFLKKQQDMNDLINMLFGGLR